MSGMPNISDAEPGSEKTGIDLLDEATRLADDYRNLDEGRVLRALVERVQQAEARAVAPSETRTRLLTDQERREWGDVLAILCEKAD